MSAKTVFRPANPRVITRGMLGTKKEVGLAPSAMAHGPTSISTHGQVLVPIPLIQP